MRLIGVRSSSRLSNCKVGLDIDIWGGITKAFVLILLNSSRGLLQYKEVNE